MKEEGNQKIFKLVQSFQQSFRMSEMLKADKVIDVQDQRAFQSHRNKAYAQKLSQNYRQKYPKIVQIIKKRLRRNVPGQNKRNYDYLVEWEDETRSWEQWGKVGPYYYALVAEFQLINQKSHQSQSRKVLEKPTHRQKIDYSNINIDDMPLPKNELNVKDHYKHGRNVYRSRNSYLNRQRPRKEWWKARDDEIEMPIESKIIQDREEERRQAGLKMTKDRRISNIIALEDSEEEPSQIQPLRLARMTTCKPNQQEDKIKKSSKEKNEEDSPQQQDFIFPVNELNSPQNGQDLNVLKREQQLNQNDSKDEKYLFATVNNIVKPQYLKERVPALPSLKKSASSPE